VSELTVPANAVCDDSLVSDFDFSGTAPHRKRIGFLSFGHWSRAAGSQTQSAGDSLLQAVELAVAAEEIGIDGAYFRVHHYQRQHASPFPLLAAIGTATERIEIGTGVIDMRYENPLYMAEDAASADLLAGGRLQLGISRGSPEPALRGYEAFGHVPAEGETDADMARHHTELFRAAIAGAPLVNADARMAGGIGRLAIQPQSPGLPERIWWGAGTRPTGVWTAEQGMNLMSSTLLSEDTGVPFDQLQAEQIEAYLEAWRAAGWERRPRISVSRSVMPIVSDLDHAFFGREAGGGDTVGYLDGGIARFGKTYAGEPDRIAAELAEDRAVALADTLLVTVPNQLGVDYNADLLRNIADHVAPAIGWSPAGAEARTR
jgi:alkanesulfonate monooxygenase SsuD/methylene tetrahydromethanopterin reductase-like flavin-dependent oxidoreductase (luciferase family)